MKTRHAGILMIKTPEHPHLLIVREAATGLRTLRDLRASVQAGHGRRLWQRTLFLANHAVQSAPLTAFTPLAGRQPEDIRQGNREYGITRAAGLCVTSCALAALITEQPAYKAAALRQVEALFDAAAWPEWQDIHHRRVLNVDADLRTGQLCLDLGLAYDWLHPLLSEKERMGWVVGLDRCGIQPYLRAVAEKPGWLDRMNNWTTVIVGGLGICGMALAGEHDQAERLIELALPRMNAYLDHYGPEGEFNENPGYAGSSRLPAMFFTAWRYQRREAQPSPQIARLYKHCIWQIYATIPPGEVVPFGDCPTGRKAGSNVSYFPAVAAATRDPMLQGFYLHYNGSPQTDRQAAEPDAVQQAESGEAFDRRVQEGGDPIWELMFYDATLEPDLSALDRLPLGRVFPAHSGIISSRSSWDQETAACVVMSQAGSGGVNHTHPDAGQVIIQGYGRPLIRDLGSVSYPSGNKRNYYHFNSSAHNILTFDGQDLIWDRTHCARIAQAAFDDRLGGIWTIDSTDLHANAVSVKRTVVHFLPGIVAVLDEAVFAAPGAIRVRWHPGTPAVPDGHGAFTVAIDGVSLSGRIVSLDRAPLRLTTGVHHYDPPYDHDRMGNPLPQRGEPFIDARVESDRCRILSLFAVHAVGREPCPWEGSGTSWCMETAAERIEVQATGARLQAVGLESGLSLRLLDRHQHNAQKDDGHAGDFGREGRFLQNEASEGDSQRNAELSEGRDVADVRNKGQREEDQRVTRPDGSPGSHGMIPVCPQLAVQVGPARRADAGA